MRETQLSKTIRAEGEHQGNLHARQASVLEGLSLKLGSTVPEPIRLAVEGTNDLETLHRWFRAVFTVGSWEEFEAQMPSR